MLRSNCHASILDPHLARCVTAYTIRESYSTQIIGYTIVKDGEKIIWVSWSWIPNRWIVLRHLRSLRNSRSYIIWGNSRSYIKAQRRKRCSTIFSLSSHHNFDFSDLILQIPVSCRIYQQCVCGSHTWICILKFIEYRHLLNC